MLIVTCLQIRAQHVEFDIFGNLQYESEDERYKAYLKKDIFDNLIFSDNNNNELRYNKKYLDLYYKDALKNKEDKISFFRSFISEYISEKGYKATFDVDIFDKVIIKDNLNNKVEIGTDIFGNQTYEEIRNGVKTTMKTDLSGNLEYKSAKEQAFLKKDIFNKWTYSDSSGNKFEFSNKTWNRLKYLYVSEEDILFFLINEFLYL